VKPKDGARYELDEWDMWDIYRKFLHVRVVMSVETDSFFFVFFSQAVVDSGAMESLVLCLEEPAAMSWVVNPIFSDTPL
jgi:hypothetical protein